MLAVINPALIVVLAILVLMLLLLFISIKIVREYDRLVVFRLGRFQSIRGPGLVLIAPGVERPLTVSLRQIAADIPPQDIITRDNVTVRINAVIYYRVTDPRRAIVEIQNYWTAIINVAQTTLRSTLGQHSLDELLSSQASINETLKREIDQQTEPWGIAVTRVETRSIDLPVEMQRAMAREAEAERERRAKIIAAEGEQQASARLAEAAETISRAPGALHLRTLQTLAEVATEQNSTLIFPIPIEIMEGIKYYTRQHQDDRPAEPAVMPTVIPTALPEPPREIPPAVDG